MSFGIKEPNNSFHKSIYNGYLQKYIANENQRKPVSKAHLQKTDLHSVLADMITISLQNISIGLQFFEVPCTLFCNVDGRIFVQIAFGAAVIGVYRNGGKAGFFGNGAKSLPCKR